MIHPIHLPEINVRESEGDSATFVLEPLHTGFGVTLGNSLRRVLLSSLAGAAITGFKVDGAKHEYSTLEGVKEDLVEIMLNLKQVRFRVFSDEQQTLTLKKKGQGAVTAKDIATNADVEIVNPDLHIATLDNAKAELNIELKVEKGRGYQTVDQRTDKNGEIGLIAIDALFSPIKKVRYKVENTRVGQITNLDKLVIDVETDGSVAPEDALQQAANILVDQFGVVGGNTTSLSLQSKPEEVASEDGEPAEIDFSVEDLTLSPRTTNALVNNDINTVRQLIDLSDSELKSLKGFGAKAYQEVIDKLKELELR
ncbi:MAG: DNA-directed RNA polymerase subunit alpha [Candidatus Saccharimonadales bacterium]